MITKFLGNAHKHRVESCYWHWSYTEKSIEILIFFLDDQEISFSQTLLHDFFYIILQNTLIDYTFNISVKKKQYHENCGFQ